MLVALPLVDTLPQVELVLERSPLRQTQEQQQAQQQVHQQATASNRKPKERPGRIREGRGWTFNLALLRRWTALAPLLLQLRIVRGTARPESLSELPRAPGPSFPTQPS